MEPVVVTWSTILIAFALEVIQVPVARTKVIDTTIFLIESRFICF